MEIKLRPGDKIQVPTGCKATIEDNQIIIEETQEEFKNGDILHSKYDDTMLIHKKTGPWDFFCAHFITESEYKYGWRINTFRHATEEEKQRLFDILKEKGLRWNTETKEMEKIRRRAKKRKQYLMIITIGDIDAIYEFGDNIDNSRYNAGNYYLLEEREQAEKDAAKVRAIFQERLKVKL